MAFSIKGLKRGEVHWSRDYVEHLRTAHFALIAASAGLIALVLTAKPYDARRALTQVQEILELKKRWSTDLVSANVTKLPEARVFRPGAVTVVKEDKDGRAREQRESATDKQQEGVPKEKEDCAVREENHSLFTVPFSNIVYAAVPGTADPRVDAKVLELHLSGAWSPNPEWQEHNEFSKEFPASNLREMKAWWDGLSNSRFAALVGELVKDCVVFDYSRDAEPISCSLLTHGAHGTGYAIRNWAGLGRVDHKVEAAAYFAGPALQSDCGYYNEHRGGYWFTGWYADHLVRVYASYSVIKIDQSVVARALGENTGPFVTCFTDLSQAGQGLEALPLEKIEDRLAEEVAKGGDTLEAFGLKLPAEQITNWGTVLLLCAQLYLIVYLMQLWGRLKNDDDGWNVPWIALEDSWLGQSMYAVSLSVAPLAVGLLRFHALRPSASSHPTWLDWVGFVLPTLLSAALAAACWFHKPLQSQADTKQEGN